MPAPAFIIADTNSIYRRGMTHLLFENFSGCTINDAADCNKLLAAVQHEWYDIVLMDVHLAGNGFEAVRTLNGLYNNCCIIMYAHVHDAPLMVQAFAAGAVGFFYSSTNDDVIIYKTKEVLEKGCCIAPDEFKAYRAAQNRINHVPQHKPLSPREKEVLQLVQTGITSKEIAEQLSLSVKTIENHRCNIMTKTGRHGLAQLLLYAQETAGV